MTYSYYYFRFISWRWELGKVLISATIGIVVFRDGDRNATDFCLSFPLISSASRCQIGKSLWMRVRVMFDKRLPTTVSRRSRRDFKKNHTKR